MKKMISAFMALLVVFSLSVPAFATNKVNDGSEWQEIAFEDVVLRKMAYDNISYDAAREELLQEEQRILGEIGKKCVVTQSLATQSDLIKYYNYEKEFTYSENASFACAINATIVTVSDYGTTRYIDRVDMLSTRRVAGLYSSEWIEQSVSSNISTDKKSVRLAAAGHFKVTASTSSSVTANLIGFTVSGSVGSEKIYLSNTMYPTTTYYA